MSAVVFLDIVLPSKEAERIVASIQNSVPVAYATIAGTDRIEVYFSKADLDDSEARESLEKAITAFGDEAHEFVRVVYPDAAD
jgi:hypothetical protein